MARLLKVVLLLAVISAAGYGGWLWQQGTLPPLFSLINNTALAPLVDQLINAGEELLPGPLRGPINQRAGTLTPAGILTETNRHREIHDLPPLSANTLLNQAAQKKVTDMFTRQYFAHEAPDGTGPSDLVKGVNYDYIRVGENLALGNFASDAAVVQAWMDSPGHRENMLHKGFTELGVAVGRGEFEGTTVWLAVQTFAAPLSSCPQVDPALQKQFDALKSNLDQATQSLSVQQTELQALQDELEQVAADIKELAEEGNRKIKEGNEEIAEGNRIYQETGDQSQAQPHWDRGKQLQDEGEALIAQAQAKQGDYDELFQEYDGKRTAFNEEAAGQKAESETIATVTSRLNQQIRAFNNCVK